MKAESILPICFGLVFLGVTTWFLMVSALFRRLKRDHPEKFHTMGEPVLILNNTPRTNWTFIRFLFKREDRALNDPSLSRLSKIMLIFLVCYCILFIAFVAFTFADVIPDRALTKSAMVETSVRIRIFVDHNKELPASLTLLPRREGYANRVVDAWKRPLIYVVNSQGRFTLTSLGRDGVGGGTGDDADIIQKYKVIDGNVRREP